MILWEVVLAFQNGLGCFHSSIISEVMIFFVNPVKLVKNVPCSGAEHFFFFSFFFLLFFFIYAFLSRDDNNPSRVN